MSAQQMMNSDDDDLDNWGEEESTFQCLFCDNQQDSCSKLFGHMLSCCQFDFRNTRKQKQLDFYQTIRMINFIRSEVKNGKASAEIIKAVTSESDWLKDERFLKPVMEDDSLLFSFDDDDDESENEDDDEKKDGTPNLQLENAALRRQVEEMQQAMTQMRATMLRLNFLEEGDQKTKDAVAVDENSNEKQYFGGYSGRDIHEEMLKDTARTCAYRDFMYNNPQIFKDKVVLDIGCGTGILSMFAAKSGARKVIGIDAADIIDKAREIVKANKLDHIITLVKSKVEEATLPVESVDLIVSEWMGYFLLFESMLPSVLFARDKWLVKDGGVYPNQAIMYIAGMETNAYRTAKVDFWSDVYGFDMTCLRNKGAIKDSTAEAINPKALITDNVCIKDIDILKCKDEELDFASDFKLTVTKDEELGAFVVWFDCNFDYLCNSRIVLGTGPHDKTTHWYQTLFYLEQPLSVKKGDFISGKISASRGGTNHRDYDVIVQWQTQTPGGSPSEVTVRAYAV